ncbi:MAG: hypothetical protein ACTSUN_01425 [Promethearchaeota archaeon]
MKKEHLFKVTMNFKKFGNRQLIFFIVPRGQNEDWEKEEEAEEEEGCEDEWEA